MLRKLNKLNDYPVQIRDPDNQDVIIHDPIRIMKKLTLYWANLGNATNQNNQPLSERIKKLHTECPDLDALPSIILDE